MEQIYTIPVGEAFDEVGQKPECGCPFCVLYRRLQNDEIDIILGASMMEPDIRMKTNEQGFCLTHYNIMLRRKRMLGMGLMLESHLAEVEKKIEGPTLLGNKVQASVAALGKLESDCYVCSRIDRNLSAMIATAVYLFESDLDFPKRFAGAPYFCLPHYSRMMEYASKKMSKRAFRDFYDVAHGIESKYVKSLQGDVSWFCKKFDYRYDEEPWYNAKDSVYRSIKFLSGDPGVDD
ncbi:MAG: hypothetical protein J6V09_07180 [Clostridia bacterium]|nr:hypothetical protein [Clostridia bacterium]